MNVNKKLCVQQGHELDKDGGTPLEISFRCTYGSTNSRYRGSRMSQLFSNVSFTSHERSQYDEKN